MSLVMAAMIGWCGTKWPGWWRGPRPPQPDPEPWWREIVRGIIGAVGGIAAVSIIGPDFPDSVGLMGTAVLGFFGGVFLGSLADAVMGMGRGAAR